MKTIDLPVYTSAARTATPTAVEIAVGEYDGVHLYIDVTAAAATPSVVPTVDAYDPLSEKWYNLLTGAAITAVSTATLRIGLGLEASANVTANDFLPDKIRVTMTHADADSITYSINAKLMRNRFN